MRLLAEKIKKIEKKNKKVLTKKSRGDIFIITRRERAAATKFFERQSSEGKKKAGSGAAGSGSGGIDAYNEHSSRAGRPCGRPRGAFLINQGLVRRT